jgi:peptidoglycan/LPS O-acetylase OafA/YrhL
MPKTASSDRIEAPQLPSHIPSLDGFRAMSILLVLVGHVAATHGAPAWMDRAAIASLGNVGVRFFFVVSGFLITTLMLRDMARHGHIRMKLFYQRRSLRILPAAFFYVAVIWALHMAGFIDLTYHLTTRTHADSALPDLIHALTFTANYQHDYNWYYNHLWSLSVEEQFYLIWPVTLFFLKPRRAMQLAALMLLVAPVVRWLMFSYGSGPEIRLSREFQAVADALATGCLAALLHNHLSEKAWFMKLVSWPALPICAACIAAGYGVALVYRPAAYVVGQTLANIGIVILLQHIVRFPQQPLGRLFNTRPLVYIGVMSYSLYLWQEPFLNFRSEHWLSSFPQNLVLAFLAAWASHRWIEKPFLRIKDRLN